MQNARKREVRWEEDLRDEPEREVMAVESKIVEYVRKLDPEVLGLSEKPAVEAERLGLGESHLNYLVKVDGKRFVFRIDADPSAPDKSRREFGSLRMVEGLGIAPKAFHYESSRKRFGGSFIILEYLEGETLENKRIGAETIRELARTVACLHNTPVGDVRKRLRRNGSSKRAILGWTRRRIDYIDVRRKRYFPAGDRFSVLLAKTLNDFKTRRIGFEPMYVLGHGDIAPQNVIMHSDKLALIDWEDVGLIDAAVEIAVIFDSFDFTEGQKVRFLKEYLNLRKDVTIRRRIEAFWPIQLFGVFCWAVMHVFEIGERELHEKFIQEQNLQRHIDYAGKMFQKCRKQGIFTEETRWKSREVFPDKYFL